MGDLDEQATAVESNATDGSEGAAGEPTTDDVQSMYDDLGVKAKAPTDKSSKRPKASGSGDKKTAKKDDESGKSEKGRASDDGKDKSKASSSSDSDGSNGDDTDASSKKDGKKGGKDGEKDGQVSEDGDKDAKGVSGSKSEDNGKTAKSGKDDVEEGNNGTGQAEAKSEGSEEKGSEAEKGKRPGKSSPEIEKRFQKLTEEKRQAEQKAVELEKKLQEKDQLVRKTKVAQEDPEYKIDDFRKVQDKDGNIIDLDAEQAELAWRRWKDGYDSRKADREAKVTQEASDAKRVDEVSRQIMEQSVKAYDTLTNLQEEYPELVSDSGKYDPDFAADAMPIIKEAIQYLDGTEPGNAEGKLPVIIGLKIDPKKILEAMKAISSKKRNLPLNGVNDSVESKSNVSVPHSRSSDPNVNAANELYKELGIKKRI